MSWRYSRLLYVSLSLVFFFFKQKTAYEMRISDWSSDVCSSDLFYFLTGIGARLELALMSLGLDRALTAGFTPMIPPTLVRPEVMRGTGFLGEHADEEIGRASCREGVCQYV